LQAADEPSPRAGASGVRRIIFWWAPKGPLSVDRPGASDALVVAPAKKEANEEARDDELDRRREAATAVPAMEPVAEEELAPARPREAKDVLEVRRRSGECAADGWIERSPDRGEEQNSGDARADLEAAVGDVLVWHPIACEVEQQPER